VGLLVKQSLFEGVLSKGNNINYVDFSTKGRSQFIRQLEELVSQQEAAPEVSMAAPEVLTAEQGELTAASRASATGTAATPAPVAASPAPRQTAKVPTPASQKQAAELEQVLNSGMRFLAGLFKMSTGTDINLKDQKIEIDSATGEVLMRFKIK
jgi:hypothetical protein